MAKSKKRTSDDMNPYESTLEDELRMDRLSIADDPVSISIKPTKKIGDTSTIFAIVESGILYWDQPTGNICFLHSSGLIDSVVTLDESTGYNPENCPNVSIYDDKSGAGLYALFVHPDGVFFVYSLMTGKILLKHAFMLDHTKTLENVPAQGIQAYNPGFTMLTEEWIVATCTNTDQTETTIIIFPWKCMIMGTENTYGCKRVDLKVNWTNVTCIKHFECYRNVIFFGTPHGVFNMDLSLPSNIIFPVRILTGEHMCKKWKFTSDHAILNTEYNILTSNYHDKSQEEKLEVKRISLHQKQPNLINNLSKQTYPETKHADQSIIDIYITLSQKIMTIVTNTDVVIINTETKKIIPLNLPRVICTATMETGACIFIRDDLTVLSINANSQSTEPDICTEHITNSEGDICDFKVTDITYTNHLLSGGYEGVDIHAFGSDVYTIHITAPTVSDNAITEDTTMTL